MSFKFRKRLRIFPGFTLNLSKSGLSATVGMRGLNVNIGSKGKYLNVGIPGTGIYDRVRLNNGEKQDSPPNSNTPDTRRIDSPREIPAPTDASEIKSFNPELITSEGLFGLKESIIDAEKDKRQLCAESLQAQSEANSARRKMVFSKIFLIGFFVKSFEKKFREQQKEAEEAAKAYSNFKVDIDFNFDDEIKNDYLSMRKCFDQLCNVDTIWDIKTEQENDRFKTRSAASYSVNKEKIYFEIVSLDFINTKYEALKMQNANGGDLYFYPGFIAIKDGKGNEFGLLDFRDLIIEHHPQKFVETGHVPSDTKVVGNAWKYVNKNGQPDRRFKDNYEIPIVLYYDFNISSKSGLYESYQFSNPNFAAEFCAALVKYRDVLMKLKWSSDQAQISH
jgi:hypothetical protein